jgi:hypothetical protein
VLENGKAGAEIDLHFSCAGTSEVSDFLMRRVQVLYAGAVAQTLRGPTIDPALCRSLLDINAQPPDGGTAAHDFAKLKELLRLWIAIRYPNSTLERFGKQLEEADRVLSNAAAKLIIAEATVIHDLTSYLMDCYNRRPNRQSTKFEGDQGRNRRAT